MGGEYDFAAVLKDLVSAGLVIGILGAGAIWVAVDFVHFCVNLLGDFFGWWEDKQWLD